MLLFHGTTIENARQILKSGFTYNKQTWNCSQEETYFFKGDYFEQEYGLESREAIIEHCVREALQQSLITLAIENPVDYRGAVLVFDSDLMKNGNEIEPDYSCENMSEIAVALKNPDLQGLIGVYEMTESQAALRIYTLAQVSDNHNLMEVELSKTEELLVNAVSGNDGIMCEFSEISSEVEYKELDLNQTINQRLVA